jgi:hypothetical protein
LFLRRTEQCRIGSLSPRLPTRRPDERLAQLREFGRRVDDGDEYALGRRLPGHDHADEHVSEAHRTGRVAATRLLAGVNASLLVLNDVTQPPGSGMRETVRRLVADAKEERSDGLTDKAIRRSSWYCSATLL